MNRREFLAAGICGTAAVALASAAEGPRNANLGLLLYSYGQRLKVERQQGFADPARFLEFAHRQGARAVQIPLGHLTHAQAIEVRQLSDRLEMNIEGIVTPPRDKDADLLRFSSELQSANECSVSVVRTVMLGGRRYEVFEKEDEFDAFARGADEALKRAVGIAERHKVTLAVENHKDYRVDEFIDLLQRISSEWVGVCLDTGNNLALLNEPYETVEALAPFTRTVHLKDIGVEESDQGFLMAEVPLGRGVFDLPRMVATIRRANPNVIFQLEMITRDPLVIPCLTDKYWATMSSVPGRDLARTLATVKKLARKVALLRVSPLPAADQLAAEDRNVRESFEFAARTRLIPS